MAVPASQWQEALAGGPKARERIFGPAKWRENPILSLIFQKRGKRLWRGQPMVESPGEFQGEGNSGNRQHR